MKQNNNYDDNNKKYGSRNTPPHTDGVTKVTRRYTHENATSDTHD